MDTSGGRFKREFNTLRAMTRLYCAAFHRGSETRLCSECGAFLEYAKVRVERCTFGEDKPACADCPVHCYKPKQREQARTIMRYAGPRMPIHHPLMTALHYWDKFRSASRVKKWRQAREARRGQN
ncbi:MAG: nitrous oxide-stimulated promoter family protein [Deltaproteobacteria bacterium]|nr:nitrous oxide-stimulated promoter family protein [Deltaproteobacteria bacterium]